MRGERAATRWILSAAVLLLGTVAALRLPVSYLPTRSFPELVVSLDLPRSGSLERVTREWVLPVESAIRSLGRVRAFGGEVFPGGARLRVRLPPGTDPYPKAARLDAMLGETRRRLPEGGSLEVWPAAQAVGDWSAVLWLDEAEGALDRSLLDALAALPEVRTLGIAAEEAEELWVRPRPEHRSAPIRAGIEEGLAVSGLGSLARGERRTPVATAAAADLADLPISEAGRTLPLRALARLEWRPREPPWQVRDQGRPGRALIVGREAEASPLALRSALERTLEAHGRERYRFLFDEAVPSRRLLSRLGLGAAAGALLFAGLVLALAGTRPALAALVVLPLALGAALNGFWLVRLPLDLATAPSLAIAVAGCLLAFALRLGGAASLSFWATAQLAATLPAVAIALTGGRLSPALALPAWAFLVAVWAALPMVWLPPLATTSALGAKAVARTLRAFLRQGGLVLLAGSSAAYLLFALFGQALNPQSVPLFQQEEDVVVGLRFGADLPLAGTVPQVELVERHLSALPEVASHWAILQRGQARILVDLVPEERAAHRLRAFVARLRSELAASPVALTVEAAGERGGESALSEDLEDRARVDKALTRYQMVLRSTDLGVLRRAHDRVLERLYRLLAPGAVSSDWSHGETRVELHPRPGVEGAVVRRAAEHLRRRATFPPARPLPGEGEHGLRVLAADSPASEREVPSRRDLLESHVQAGPGRAALPTELFFVREVASPPAVRRQSGRFAVRVNVRLSGMVRGARARDRLLVEGSLGRLALPPGSDLELARGQKHEWRRERWRILATAGTLPLLAFALAACRLNGVFLGLASLGPLLLGLGTAAPVIRSAQGRVDEPTLLALAAALVVALPAVLELGSGLLRGGASPLAGGLAYGWLRGRIHWLLVAGLAFACCLVVPGLGLESARHPWVLPLRSGAVVVLVAAFAASFFLPVLVRGVLVLAARDRRLERRRAHPPAWAESGLPELEVRNLTKIYGDGFRALDRVSFRLEPGIVGLLGPNGAGKTTLLRLLCGLLESTRGRALFRGVPILPTNLPQYRRLVGFLPQDFNAYEGFTGEEFLDYWAMEKGILDRRERRREIESALDQVGLLEAAGRKVRDYSGGMRRRIGIARALLGAPPILIVDEPTTGLDVESRNRLRESLLSAAGERLILFSTHIASDVQAAASRILVLCRGRLLFDGSAHELRRLAEGRVFEALVPDKRLAELSHEYRVTTRVRTLEGIRLRAVLRPGQRPAGRLVEPNLEEAYLSLLGEAEGLRGTAGLTTGVSLLDLESS